MDTILEEVYKWLIKDGDVNNPYFKGSECVAVKILRSDFCCCCCSPRLTVCMCDCACLLLPFVAEANAALKSNFLKEIATM